MMLRLLDATGKRQWGWLGWPWGVFVLEYGGMYRGVSV
jgi:hypothetical protein